MAVTVDTPDGPVDFPDEMKPDEIKSVLQKKYGAPKAAAPVSAPKSEDGQPGDSAPTTTSQALGFRKGFLTPIDNAATWIEGGLNKIGVPVSKINSFLGGKDASTYRDEHRQYIADQEKAGVKPGLPGEIAGSILGTAPVALATRNPWLIGAGSGALESDADTPGGVAKDAAEGAIFGKVGDTVLRAAGSVVAPVFRTAVNDMLKKGVRLTPGQIMGGSLHKIEDAATSIPFLGDLVTASQKRGLQDFNKVAADEALAPLGLSLPKNVPPGHESVKYVQDTLGKAYDAVIPHITVDMSQMSASTRAGSAALARQVRKLPSDLKNQYGQLLQDEVLSKFQNGKMTGQALKDAEQILGNEAREFHTSSNPHDRRYADAVSELQSQLRSLAADSNPRYAPALQAINKGYSNLVRVETAAAPAKGGVFTPGGLQSATRKMDPSIRKRASAAGQAKMQDLAEQGNDTLARTLGETGTASRATINTLAGMALFGGGAALHINPMAAAAFAPILAPYTRAGGTAFRASIRRPAGALQVRRAMEKARPQAAIAAGRAMAPSSSPPDQEE